MVCSGTWKFHHSRNLHPRNMYSKSILIRILYKRLHVVVFPYSRRPHPGANCAGSQSGSFWDISFWCIEFCWGGIFIFRKTSFWNLLYRISIGRLVEYTLLAYRILLGVEFPYPKRRHSGAVCTRSQ